MHLFSLCLAVPVLFSILLRFCFFDHTATTRRVDMLRRQVLCSWVHSVLFVPTVADVASLSVARKMCCALDVLRSLFDIEGKGPTGPIAEFVLVLPALVSAASTQLYAAHFIHVKLRVYGLFCEILSLLQMSELEECCHLTLRSLQLSAFHDWITVLLLSCFSPA